MTDFFFGFGLHFSLSLLLFFLFPLLRVEWEKPRMRLMTFQKHTLHRFRRHNEQREGGKGNCWDWSGNRMERSLIFRSLKGFFFLFSSMASSKDTLILTINW